jgi:TolB-like protein/DNA-binding winged helix-turn-helix (wHTH) protein
MSERYLVAGGLSLDRQDARVSVDGAPVRLGARAFDLLTVLMERPQVLLTKEEIFARVWAGVTVSDAVLTTAMKELRQAIGDSARQPRFIETAHGRGYRFLLPVSACDDVADAANTVSARPGRARRHELWALTVALGLIAILGSVILWARPQVADQPHPKSIAVLPFEDLSPEGDQRWFADGLAEELQTTLARSPDLRTVSRVSAARLIRRGSSGQEVANRLGASQFLEGSVRRAGDRVRITVKLVNARDGAQVWAQNYDRSSRDVISIQEDIAFQIASSLRTVMDPDDLRVMVSAGTRSVEAYEAYLRGLAMDQRQFEDGDLAFALAAADAYELARVLDPGFAAAQWKAAETWFGNQTRMDSSTRASVSEAGRLARYLERIDAAIAASRGDTERLKYRAARATMELQVGTSKDFLSRYVAARPRDIDAWEELADVAAYAGDRETMRRAAERVHTLSVQEGEPRSRAITLSVMAMDLDVAVRQAREQLALRPDNVVTLYQAHRALIWSGQIEDAARLLKLIEASDLERGSRLLAEMRQACAEGRVAEATALRARIDESTGLTPRWLAAQLAGDLDGAEAMLRSMDTPARLPALMQYLINPSFDVADYPVLAGHLRRNGATLRRAEPVPYACPVQQRRAAPRGLAA